MADFEITLHYSQRIRGGWNIGSFSQCFTDLNAAAAEYAKVIDQTSQDLFNNTPIGDEIPNRASGTLLNQSMLITRAHQIKTQGE